MRPIWSSRLKLCMNSLKGWRLCLRAVVAAARGGAPAGAASARRASTSPGDGERSASSPSSALASEAVASRLYYNPPLHLQPAFADLGLRFDLTVPLARYYALVRIRNRFAANTSLMSCCRVAAFAAAKPSRAIGPLRS